jgi:CheY-like chemotaxis protein/HPt (histidine-containing phosphotransfer) domain-containing protein
MTTPPINDSIRLPQRELEQLLLDLNRQQTATADSKRRTRRWTMPLSKGVLTLTDSAMRQSHHLVVPRNLSSGGMSFLLGGFVYLGTHCTITLKGLDGKAHGVGAKIARCQHVRGRLHDVGVAFDAPIKAREFIDFGDHHAFAVENVDVATLKGSLLIVEDSRADQRLYAHHFKGSGLDIQFAQDADTGLQCLADLPDVVFTDKDLPDMTGIDLISKARSSGYTGPMVLITADSGPGVRAAAIKAGASEMLLKPFTPSLLHQAAAEFLLTKGPCGTVAAVTSLSAKMVSNADERSASGEMIGDYVTELQTIADKLTSMLEVNDFAGSRQLVLQLRGNASGYGFEALTLIASETARVLDACQSVEESAVELRKLIAACRSARPRAESA